ncbi:MAG: DNA polymerase III subunit beta [bacterium]
MKIICSKEALLNGIQIVQTAVAHKSTLPILSNLVIETEKDKIKLMATDLEIGIHCLIKGEIVTEGSITIPAKKFGDIVRELSDTHDVEIETDDSLKTTITSGKTCFSLKGLPKEDYPVIPEFSDEKAFSVKKDVLKEMFKKTIFAASTDTTRYVLNGILFNILNGPLKVVATDGKRLSLISNNGGNGSSKIINSNIIIPTKTANELIRLIGLENPEQDILVNITENQVAFKSNNWSLISRLVDGSYPNYEQVIPKSNQIKISLKKDDLMAVTKRAALCMADKIGLVRYGFSNGLLKISASYQGITEFNDELECNYQGSKIEISFNPTYVIDVLKNMNTENVSLEFSTAVGPVLIRPEGDTEYIYVVMPMKTS